MFCNACGADNEALARYCRSCGTQIGAPASPSPPGGTMRGGPYQTQTVATGQGVSRKNPIVAGVLSVLIIGVGQIYNGDLKKAAIMFVAAVVGIGATAGLLWLPFAAWSGIDAYRVASGTGAKW